MKHILQTIANLINWFMLTFFSFFGVLWYGKLPKVSMYHRLTKSTLYTLDGIYNDPNSQVTHIKEVPNYIRVEIIQEYIERLRKDKRFKSNVLPISIPMFDGKEIIGEESVMGILLGNINK